MNRVRDESLRSKTFQISTNAVYRTNSMILSSSTCQFPRKPTYTPPSIWSLNKRNIRYAPAAIQH